ETKEVIGVPNRRADPAGDIELGAGRDLDRLARLPDAELGEPFDDIPSGLAAQDRVSSHSVDRTMLGGVHDHALLAILEDDGSTEVGREPVDHCLQLGGDENAPVGQSSSRTIIWLAGWRDNAYPRAICRARGARRWRRLRR